MKTTILIFLSVLLVSYYSVAQISTAADPGRGMYVDNFFKMISGSAHDQNLTVLGYSLREDALLEYCDANQ